jgi:signal transduction histidine kinase
VQLDRGLERPADRTPASLLSLTRHDVGPGRSRQELLLGLTLISLIFIIQVAIIGTWVGLSEERAQRLYENSLTSIEQVTRIARDIAQQRILADDHILESLPAGKAQVEHQLSRVSADLHEAERVYGPLTELPSEEATWRKAQAQLVGFEKVMDAALALSREDNDRQARAKMTAALGEYADLDRTIAELIAINHLGANQAIARIQTLRRFATVGMWATGMTALLILLVLGRQIINRIASYEQQLVGYSRILEGRNRELDAFAGRIAHDLRNPVASLTLWVELMSRKAASEELPGFDRIRRNIKRIGAMIDDLLAFARAGASMEGASCNPAVVAAKIRDDFAERFGEEARLRETVGPASVTYSEGLLRQVLWNLVENGVKYRRDEVQAEIGVFGRVAGERYELRVSDNGLGMLPEDAQRAFDPFYRSQSAQDASGAGLGLSIVKRIVEAGGGSVQVETQPGNGTTFALQLPLAGGQSDATHDSGRER